MELNSLKDVQKLISLCRKSGISKLTIGDFSIDFSKDLLPTRKKREKEDLGPKNLLQNEEALIDWSSAVGEN